MYALVDCNNFFVSCERVFNPSLNNRPVIVLSSNDGCVIARSNEAKAAGIPMGIPVFKVRQVIEKGKFSVFSANHVLYGEEGHANVIPFFLRIGSLFHRRGIPVPGRNKA